MENHKNADQEEMLSNIRSNLSLEARLEMLAEEAAELTKEALKYARILRGENPTPIKKEDVKSSLVEEFTDLMLCAEVLQLPTMPSFREFKLERWNRRLEHHTPKDQL